MELEESLQAFSQQVSGSAKILKLTKGWHPNIIIKAADTGAVFTLVIFESRVREMLKGEVNAAHEVALSAGEQILIQIFTGKINPAKAVLDGNLVLFGDQKDQIKLDIIASVIWN
jgi:putative sterol carrier protein